MRKRSVRFGYVLIFRPYIRTRRGRIIYAWQYGLKAFPIWVKAAPAGVPIILLGLSSPGS
jgi:hypothetical protein